MLVIIYKKSWKVACNRNSKLGRDEQIDFEPHATVGVIPQGFILWLKQHGGFSQMFNKSVKMP